MGNAVIYTKPYDAEIEYLESTGTQWIDTGFIPDDTCGMHVRASLTTTFSRTQKCVGAGDYLKDTRWWVDFSPTGTINIGWGTYLQTDYYDTNTWYEVTNNFLNTRIGTVNGVTKRTDYPTLDSIDTSAKIFEVTANSNNFAGKISSVKFSRGSEIVMDFIPVRIGSVGYLYDKVTKQLFANKGTGQFILGNDVSNAVIPQQRCVLYFGNQRSVGYERIYEEYEWLCGRNGAYINTNHKLHTCYDMFDCRFKWDGAINNLNGNTLGVFGSYFYQNGNIWARVSMNYGYFYINYFKLVNWSIVPINGVYEVDLKSFMSSTSTEKYSFTLNGTYYEFSNNGLQEIESNTDVVLFENIPNNGSYFHGDIASFRIYHDNIDFVNMTPCKLLQSIPAILDGNGIARQAGECGMWDKVSNRFYGNVANRGSFTVSND